MLDISQNIANIASNKSLITRTCWLSNIGWWWIRRAPCSPSLNILKTTWLREKVASKNIYKNTRIISLVFSLETESFLWVNMLPNLLSWFHHIVECVEFAKASDMRACVPTWSTCQRACVPARFTCLRASVVYVPTYLRAKSVPTSHFHVPTCQWTCQRAIRRASFSLCRANFSKWRTNMPKTVPIFQTFLLRNCKGNFYTLFLYKNSTLYLISYLYRTWKLYYTSFLYFMPSC